MLKSSTYPVVNKRASYSDLGIEMYLFVINTCIFHCDIVFAINMYKNISLVSHLLSTSNNIIPTLFIVFITDYNKEHWIQNTSFSEKNMKERL